MKFIRQAVKTLTNARLQMHGQMDDDGDYICLSTEQRKRLRLADNNIAQAIKRLNLIQGRKAKS